MLSAPAPTIDPALGLTDDRNFLGVLAWVRDLDAHRVRFVTGVQAGAPGSFGCYAGCAPFFDCDCPPHQYIVNHRWP